MEKNENNQVAIKVKNVSKTFRIPHEKINSVRGVFVNALKKKNYEEFKALDDVSFEVKKGEFFGIIGRNGSGKSTLLKIIAGIYRPNKGKMKANGMISPFLELGIGFNPELSGRDNIYLNATVLGLTKKQIDKKFDDIVAFSELKRFIDQKLKNYSSGMQVRLAFSVSIHANRDILLMDEVLAVGDSNFQNKCLEEFNKYRDLGKTVILVSHDISTIQKYCDRAMLLRKGKIKMIGDPEKVGNKYIYQNMSDEEKRITTKEKKKNQKIEKDSVKKVDGKEVKRKIIEIRKVETIDKNGDKKKVFRVGDQISININCFSYKMIENPIFGIIIKNSQKNVVFVTNTEFKRIKTGTLSERRNYIIKFNLENVRLSSGKYFISPAIASDGVKVYYDWKNDFAFFNIFNDYNSGGIIDMEHTILIKNELI